MMPLQATPTGRLLLAPIALGIALILSLVLSAWCANSALSTLVVSELGPGPGVSPYRCQRVGADAVLAGKAHTIRFRWTGAGSLTGAGGPNRDVTLSAPAGYGRRLIRDEAITCGYSGQLDLYLDGPHSATRHFYLAQE